MLPVRSKVVQLLQKAMEERGWEDGKYLIDGFPRSRFSYICPQFCQEHTLPSFAFASLFLLLHQHALLFSATAGQELRQFARME